MYTPGVDGVTMPTNANGALPGSTGSLGQIWVGSWWMLPTHMPPAFDFDFTTEIYPKDNDYVGLVWRFVDRDNFYVLNMRSEPVQGTPAMAVMRRRAGVNTVLWGSAQTNLPVGVTGNSGCPDPTGIRSRVPYHMCLRQQWRVVMTGNRMEVYLPDWTTWSSVQSTAFAPRLVATIVDPDPLLAAGTAGVIATTHDGTVVYGMRVRAMSAHPAVPAAVAALPVSPASRAALVLGLDASNADPDMAEAYLADYARTGRGAYGSPFIVGVAAKPTVQPFRRCGSALNFAGAQFLYSKTRTGAEPGACCALRALATFWVL